MARAKKVEVPDEQTVLPTEVPDEAIHLLELKIRNFRRLRFAHIKVDEGGRLIWITGKNEAGKTAVLDAIHSLTEGGRSVPTNPIHDNAPPGEQSYVKGRYSNRFTVERRFTERAPNGYLTVIGPDGGEYKQRKLDEWIEGVSGDPMHLWTLPHDRLMKVLLSLTNSPDALETLAGFDSEISRIKDRRKPFNSTIQVAERTNPPDGERPKPIDVTGEMDTLKTLRNVQAQKTMKEIRLDTAKQELVRCDTQIADLEEKLREWRGRRAHVVVEIADVETELKAIEDPMDAIVEIEVRLSQATEVSRALQPWQSWDELQSRASEAREVAESLSEKLAQVEAEKAQFVSGITTKIPALTFSETLTPLLHGRELHAASGAQRARFQVDVMFAKNPALKIILIDEGAALDADYIKQLYDDAVERNFHIWICSIVDGHEGEIKIVEGRVDGKDGDD